jgi:hypothetical protein
VHRVFEIGSMHELGGKQVRKGRAGDEGGEGLERVAGSPVLQRGGAGLPWASGSPSVSSP